MTVSAEVFLLERPMTLILVRDSEHALVYCTCFCIQPDFNRGPQRKPAGASHISWVAQSEHRAWL